MLEILEPVCSALQAAHDLGIVHRDLKASNIFIANVDGKRVVKLLDFGIAKLLHPDAGEGGLTVVGTRLGTSYTMAPEQIRGDGVDARTDIYALGVVLYQLLTGQYPFRAETMADIERQHLEAPPPRPSQAAPVPPALDAVVLRCMEKTAERRYQTVKSFIEALRDAVGSKTAEPEVTAQGAAIFVEIRIGDGADAESDELLDDTSAILDATEQSLRGAGMTLPLQTGNAIIGARVLSSAAASAAGERDADCGARERPGAGAERAPIGARRRARQHHRFTSAARYQGLGGRAGRQGGRGRRAALDRRLGASEEASTAST